MFSEAQQPVVNSRIILGSLELSSDYDGRFSVEGLKVGMHTIEVIKEGYLTRLDRFMVRSQETTEVEIILEKGADFLSWLILLSTLVTRAVLYN
ncbi:carboxypeptidase-like regulatory domain-containing protein [Niabella hibiscisoli]|uniref:carboxypeptidase-like regulatory domain-containing protein n=1 Tax=Niabella hibiscisoli TaxID=1825928 RepID=UPI00293F4C61|nr:hypothetical protein [Niabella hibiscisoli]